LRRLALAAALPALAACAAKPVLYPNAHLSQVGKRQAELDIEDCENLAKENIRSRKAARAAAGTAESGAVGAAGGAAAGAVLGHVARGAAVGGAAGAAGGLTREIFKSSRVDPVFKRFVDRCLRDKGYEPIGWQ